MTDRGQIRNCFRESCWRAQDKGRPDSGPAAQELKMNMALLAWTVEQPAVSQA